MNDQIDFAVRFSIFSLVLSLFVLCMNIAQLVSIARDRRRYGQCLRCNKPWNCVEHHTTNYTEHYGCFPLCERCWLKLGTPESRMPYYEQLWKSWIQSGDQPQEKWDQIKTAVLAGK